MNFTYDPGEYLDSQPAEAIARHLEVDQKIALLRKMAPAAVQHGGQFLDVGCGMGGYMLAARALGFEVLGFEPSRNHARVARDLLKLEVVADYFDPAVVEGRRFDLIMLSHVIEHIYEPKAFIGGLLSVLAPGGTLIIMTPNAESIIARLCGKRWPMLLPADHVTMLAPDAIPALVGPEYDLDIQTMEYAHEFAAALGSAVRAAANGKRARTWVAHETPTTIQSNGHSRPLVRMLLSVFSLPFHLTARALDRSSCIAVAVHAPAAAEDGTGRACAVA